jgi:hypothetical protein
MCNLYCLKCEGISFKAKPIAMMIKNKIIKCPAWVCDNCNEPLMDSEQMDQCLKENKRRGRTYAEREKEKIEKLNQKWGKRDDTKDTNQKHPWKRSYYKDSIDDHVLKQ